VSFEDPTDEDMAARRTIIDTDPPGHAKLRKILSGSFTQRAGALDLVCDIADAGQVDELIAAVAGKFGRLDGLVLNAGVIAQGGVAELPAADFAAMVAVNLTRPVPGRQGGRPAPTRSPP
jgi:NAD(P)-dependent dehydrogenase (short-subunit alcohol dehydrogenase family)